MNKVFLIGRWTRDLESKQLSNGNTVASGTLAVDDGYGDKKKTYFLPVVIWGKTAEAVIKHSGKGKLVAVEGKLVQRTWEKDGKKHSAVEVWAEQVDFLEFKQKPQTPDDEEPLQISDEDLPF